MINYEHLLMSTLVLDTSVNSSPRGLGYFIKILSLLLKTIGVDKMRAKYWMQ